MKINGIEGLTGQQISFELQRGARFVIYQYCVSILILTFKRPSGIFLIRAGESPVGRGLVYSLISILFGWWGIPWGPIYTVQSLARNFGGGLDVTEQVLTALQRQSA